MTGSGNLLNVNSLPRAAECWTYWKLKSIAQGSEYAMIYDLTKNRDFTGFGTVYPLTRCFMEVSLCPSYISIFDIDFRLVRSGKDDCAISVDVVGNAMGHSFFPLYLEVDGDGWRYKDVIIRQLTSRFNVEHCNIFKVLFLKPYHRCMYSGHTNGCPMERILNWVSYKI